MDRIASSSRQCRRRNFIRIGNTPVTLHRNYTELARRRDICQSSVGSTKNAENLCKLFNFHKSDIIITASLRRLWRFYGVPVEYCSVPRRVRCMLRAVTAHTRHPQCVGGVPETFVLRLRGVKAVYRSRSPIQYTSMLNFQSIIHYNFITTQQQHPYPRCGHIIQLV